MRERAYVDCWFSSFFFSSYHGFEITRAHTVLFAREGCLRELQRVVSHHLTQEKTRKKGRKGEIKHMEG